MVELTEVALTKHERLARYQYRAGQVPASGGASRYTVQSGPYFEKLKRANAPCLTGFSGTSYILFKTLAYALELNKDEMILLRRCLVAYMLPFKDHSLYEVLDAVNEALLDEDFYKAFDFDPRVLVIPLENHPYRSVLSV